jgi:hypothetical protein
MTDKTNGVEFNLNQVGDFKHEPGATTSNAGTYTVHLDASKKVSRKIRPRVLKSYHDQIVNDLSNQLSERRLRLITVGVAIGTIGTLVIVYLFLNLWK